ERVSAIHSHHANADWSGAPVRDRANAVSLGPVRQRVPADRRGAAADWALRSAGAGDSRSGDRQHFVVSLAARSFRRLDRGGRCAPVGVPVLALSPELREYLRSQSRLISSASENRFAGAYSYCFASP